MLKDFTSKLINLINYGTICSQIDNAEPPDDKVKVEKFNIAVQKAINYIKRDDKSKTYRFFEDNEEIKNWAKVNCRRWVNLLSKTEKTNLLYYTGNAYVGINQYLRGEICNLDETIDISSEEYAELIEDITHRRNIYKNQIGIIDIAINKFLLKDNLILFRQLDSNGFNYLTSEMTRDFVEGDILHDGGYLSTSLKYIQDMGRYHTSEGTVLLIIRAPKFIKGAYISDVAVITSECEFLLARGTSLIIDKIYFKERDNLILICDVQRT